MNFVVAAIGFGMLGLFLPLTIYLQSVLGLTALQAGLTTAPMSLISMFVAPVAGRFADQVGGKWILFAGVSLFAGGMGILIASAHVGLDPVAPAARPDRGRLRPRHDVRAAADDRDAQTSSRGWPAPRPASSTPPASSAP